MENTKHNRMAETPVRNIRRSLLRDIRTFWRNAGSLHKRYENYIRELSFCGNKHCVSRSVSGYGRRYFFPHNILLPTNNIRFPVCTCFCRYCKKQLWAEPAFVDNISYCRAADSYNCRASFPQNLAQKYRKNLKKDCLFPPFAKFLISPLTNQKSYAIL